LAAAEGQHAPGIDLVLRSGDALLFRGHAVFHAVDGFADDGEGEEAVGGGGARASGGGGDGVGHQPDVACSVGAGNAGGEARGGWSDDSFPRTRASSAAESTPPEGWAARLQSAAKGRAGGGWRPARLALLFRDEEDSH